MKALEKETKRNELDSMAEKAIASRLVLQSELLSQLGHLLANMKITKVSIVGVGCCSSRLMFFWRLISIGISSGDAVEFS